ELLVKEVVVEDPEDIFTGFSNHGFSLGQFKFIENLFRNWELLLGIGASLFSANQRNDQLALRFLDPLFQLKAGLYCFPDHAMSMELTTEIISLGSMERTMEKDARPYILSSIPQEIHNQKKLHPYLVAKHDGFHQLSLSRLSKQFRKDLVLLTS